MLLFTCKRHSYDSILNTRHFEYINMFIYGQQQLAITLSNKYWDIRWLLFVIKGIYSHGLRFARTQLTLSCSPSYHQSIISSQSCIRSFIKSSLAMINFSSTTLQRSIRSFKPFSNAAQTVVSLSSSPVSYGALEILQIKNTIFTYRRSGFECSFSALQDVVSNSHKILHRDCKSVSFVIHS
jgi:hypothetical protein